MLTLFLVGLCPMGRHPFVRLALGDLEPIRHLVLPCAEPDARLDSRPSTIRNIPVKVCKAFPWTGSPDKRHIKRSLWEESSFFCLKVFTDSFLDTMEEMVFVQ